VSAHEIDTYLETLDGPKRAALQELRRTILAVVPDAEQGMSYGVPAFRVNGTPVAGFAAFENHLSYFPHSGTVLARLDDELRGYDVSRGTLRFPIDAPPPADLVAKLIALRLDES